MNWLSKLDELANRLLPEEDRNHDQRGDMMSIDPLLEMDLGIQYQEDNDEEKYDQEEEGTTQQPVIDVVDEEEEAPYAENEEFDDFVAGSLSFDNRSEANKIIEPIELESSILNDTLDTSQLSEQPTGDATTEQRPQQEEEIGTSMSSRSLLNTLPDEPDEDLMVDEHFSLNLRLSSTNSRNEVVNPAQKLGEVERVSQHEIAIPHPAGGAPELPTLQSNNSSPLAVPKRNRPSHPLLMTPEPTMPSAATPLFKTPDTFLSPKLDDVGVSPSPLPPTNINVVENNHRDITEFDVDQPLKDWISPHIPFNPSMNCLGVVHVRALAAQRLPCPVGSTVQLAVSLLPWKGRVRGETTVSFGGDDDTKGVCVKWDALNEGTGCSMVHSWNSEETPIPTIKMDLLFKPIKMLEFNMCTLELSCKPLLTQPGVWKKRWCQAIPSLQEKGATDHPCILVEAAFFPAASEDDNDQDQYEENVLEDSTAGEQSTRFDDASTAISSYLLKSKNRSHLLKLQSFWMPAQCNICEKSLIGWKRAFRCEACNIDCCGDCQLQIDLQIPCGSNVAKSAVKQSIQHKMSLNHVLTTIAPVDEGYKHKLSEMVEEKRRQSTGSPVELDGNEHRLPGKQGIGTFRIQVRRACLFQNALPMETEPRIIFEQSKHTSLKQGDYYVRVSCKGNQVTKRTRTIQNTGKPNFDAPDMHFVLPHYGMEYRIDVIDAYNNKAVGTTLLTAQSMLQLQRDRDVKHQGINAFIPGGRKVRYTKPLGLKLELRTGFKDGFGADYFAPIRNRSSRRKAIKVGSISGWIALDACVIEDIDMLYGPSPMQCPPRPPSNLDMELLQLHIGRIGRIIADIKNVFTWYLHVVSWKNPMLTLASLLVFLRLCFRFDAEYIACLPVSILLLIMIYLAVSRKAGHLKDRFVQREKDTRTKLDMESFVDRSLHRPLGAIQISVRKGRNLKSRELGLPGSVGCHVLWHPLRFCQNDEETKEASSIDKVLKAHHDIGDTHYLYTTNPDWESMKESDDLLRLQQLVPTQSTENQIVVETASDGGLVFPLLQPIQRHCMKIDQAHEPGQKNAVSLAQWSGARGAIVVQVRFADVINTLPGFENILGEIVIPVSKLIEKGKYEGWFQVVEVGATHYIRCAENSTSEAPRVFLQLKWQNPTIANGTSDTEREASIVVAEEMIRNATKNSRNRLNIIGSSIGALNSVRGIGGSVQTIQNTLGSVVDVIEITRNLFNFTDPQISCFGFYALFAVWVFLAIIPTRAIVFLCGMAQYSVTLSTRLSGLQSKQTNQDKAQKTVSLTEKKQQSSPPIVSWVQNALSSVPTDEDLRKAYFWESSRIGECDSSKRATETRVVRLEQLWNAKWFSVVQIKVAATGRNSVPTRAWYWEHRFVVVHGRRLLIWGSDKEFDEGDPPIDRVFLAGHAGLAGLSPIEMRELTDDEIPRVANIFGRGLNGQLKLMVLVPDQVKKEALEDVVLAAAVKDD